MGWPRNLVLVRHAESEGNVLSVDEGTVFELGTHAYPLTARGRRQAELTGEYLRAHFPSLNVFYVSYYARSKETMRIMFPNAHVYEDSRLAEAQRGIYHAMTREEIAEKYPEELKRKNREGLYHYRPFGGENWPDVELRIRSFLGTLARDYENQDVLMVVHGHWLLLFQYLIHHFSIEEAVESYRKGVFANASVTHYKNNGQNLHLESANIVPWEGKI